MRSFALLVLALFAVMCISNSDVGSIHDYCDKLWRYDTECAIKYMFTPQELEKISGIAERVRGENCKETAWNALKWVDENIKYDQEKAMLPPAEIVISPLGVKVESGERKLQTPSETVLLGKGICGDYAILTAALITYNGCTVYIANVTFANDDEGHLAAAVKINGSYFFLDQHLPPLDAGSYYKKWAGDGKTIVSVTLYSLNGSSTTLHDFSDDYTMTKADLEALENLVGKSLEKYGLKKDSRLGKNLPAGYTTGRIITYTLPQFAEFYSPEFRSELAEYIVEQLAKSVNFEGFRSYRVEVQKSGGDLEVKLYVAS